MQANPSLREAFLEKCRSHVVSPVSRPPAVVSDRGKLELEGARLTENYPDALTDTHGLLSAAPFVFKTGSPWPKATGGPDAQPFRRRLHPIGDHPIVSSWDQILTDILEYLKGAGDTFNGILPLGFGNVREPTAFCPLVVAICVEPNTIGFEAAKTVASHVKTDILAGAGFGDVDVAIWELEMSFSGTAGLTSLDPGLGDEAYRLAVRTVEKEIGTLLEAIESEEKRMWGLQARLDRGVEDMDGKIACSIEDAERNIESAIGTIVPLIGLHDEVTKLMSIVDNRVIGRVLFADPIGVSSDGDGYTRDWAAIKMKPGASRDDFQGNKVYIDDKLNNRKFLECMFPHAADRDGARYPDSGLMQLHDVVPAHELTKFKHLNANGDPALAVLKNGMMTGTTMGWLSQLDSLVRRTDLTRGSLDFWSRELTIVPHEAERGAFSEKGDSGSVVFDRGGRVVGMLTGGGGSATSTDVTFATPFCEIEKRIKEVLPDARLLD
ncbi:hypothetical protein L227DRAFT_655061 [Lentinus tigrinus ALCF2SS1-6]|uniref:Uncharacterized protein n=1 Tax=Lentinus tigrinus ALCF2SS1-6 TaxID=1328759 RepID=A0A5C2S510_9APHY|nr:hypothetical protein L227DRAFT_655061 [Lentinus tigrinus ALCF2SS1-6]